MSIKHFVCFVWIPFAALLCLAQQSAPQTVPGSGSGTDRDTMPARVQLYTPVDQGSSITFEIRNFGFKVDGSLSGLEGKISFNPEHPADAVFDVSVGAATIHTGNEMRDEHLRKESYFDVQKYPRIRFVSTHIAAGDSKGSYLISGKLTIKATTKDISFPFIATP